MTDATSPMSFPWPGSVCRDFEAEENESIRLAGSLLRTSLSRRHRHREPLSAQQRRRRQIEALLNEQVIRLDLHNAGLRFDRQRMRTVTIGLAEWVTEATALAEQYQNRTDAQSQADTDAQNARQRQIQAEMEALRVQLRAAEEEAATAEGEARSLQAQAKKIGDRARDYGRYREWIALSDEQTALAARERELERQCRDLAPDGFQPRRNPFADSAPPPALAPRRPRFNP
jgi:hypothetical protein